MKYFEMHDEVYKNLSKNGKISWDGLNFPEELLRHVINIELNKRIDHYFPKKEGVKAIEMANQNMKDLNLKAKFQACDLTELDELDAKFSVDSSLLHCLVEQEHRDRFFHLCSNITFIHTMIESDNMNDFLEREYLSLKDEILWSTGPERWEMDWHDIDGRKMFKHRRISKLENLKREIEGNGFEILEYEIKKHDHKHSNSCGHKAEKHEGHTDYEHNGHHHHQLDGHTHDCEGPHKKK